MKRSTRHLRLAGALAAVLSVPAGLTAQDQQQPPPRTIQDTTQLVFEREVFNYPGYQRPNPFKAAVEEEEVGPRFEDLILLGVIYSPDPDLSVALLGEGIAYNEQGRLQVERGQGGVQVGGREGSAPPAAQDTAAQGQGGQQAQGGQASDILGSGYKTYRVRQGDQLGNMRILEIQRMRVIVEVEEFGITERREFVLRTPANRGGQP